MTLDEAIKQAEEIADDWEVDAKKWLDYTLTFGTREDVCKEYAKCKKCAEEQRQLIEWLRELKEYRK